MLSLQKIDTINITHSPIHEEGIACRDFAIYASIILRIIVKP